MIDIRKIEQKILLIFLIILSNLGFSLRLKSQLFEPLQRNIIHKSSDLETYIIGETKLDKENVFFGSEKIGCRAVFNSINCFKLSYYTYFSHEQFNKEVRSLNELMKKYFEREVCFLNKCKHPNIVNLINYVPKYKSLYLEGGIYDLLFFIENKLEKIKNIKIKKKVVLDILICITSGLNYMHERGYVHRDLKPRNVILFKKVKKQPIRAALIDFSRVKKIEDGKNYVLSKKLVSTPLFCSNNIIVNYFNKDNIRYKYNYKDDIYSFGMIIYSILYPKIDIYKDSGEFLEKNKSKFNLNDLISGNKISFEVQQELYNLGWFPKIDNDRDDNFVIILNDLILKCLDISCDKRPSSSDILELLIKMRSEI